MDILKKGKFKRSCLSEKDEFRVKTRIFVKFIQFSSKQGCFLRSLPTWVHSTGLHVLQTPAPLPLACRDERVNLNIKSIFFDMCCEVSFSFVNKVIFLKFTCIVISILFKNFIYLQFKKSQEGINTTQKSTCTVSYTNLFGSRFNSIF